MRDFERMVSEGKGIVERNERFDLTANEVRRICEKFMQEQNASGWDNAFWNVVQDCFCAGVAVGDRCARTNVKKKRGTEIVIEIVSVPLTAEGVHGIHGACCRDGNGYKVFVDEALNGIERQTTIAHEVLHVLLGHCDGACDVGAAERAVHALIKEESKR